MTGRGNIDPTLRTLGGRFARYQTLQLLAVGLGCFGAAYQLLDNIFIGRAVEGLQCAAPINVTDAANTAALHELDWNSSDVSVGQCQITVSHSNLSEDVETYPCPYGYQYGYSRELSFRTEFDLVCDRKLLGSLVQTLVIVGQGVGAMLFSMVSDRFGRKPTLIGSQFALLVLGIGVGVAPSYPVLAALKFLIGGFQQGVATGMATIPIELLPMEYRSTQILLVGFMWGIASSSMALVAYLMRFHSWRYLQHVLSAVSLPICLLQLWYVDESLRWLLANGRMQAAERVLKRAARVNRKDIHVVLNSLNTTDTNRETQIELPDVCTETETTKRETSEERPGAPDPSCHPSDNENVEKTLTVRKTVKLSWLDIFRHKFLLAYASVIWLAWFTTAFAFFSLIMMSTNLHGNRFMNYFLATLMSFPSDWLTYFLVDTKLGRRNTACGFYILTAVGLITCGIFRVFTDNSVMGTLSVVSNTVGVLGASSVFGLVFLFTPEVFPTNMRNQALGASSFAGRLGGMLGPFMTDLAELAVWAPGTLVGSLCVLVAILFRLLPETKGRELPHTISDIKAWRSAPAKLKQSASSPDSEHSYNRVQNM